MSDPTQIENDFDLRTIDLSSIESLEIIRGAASSLYGSAAASAVIKVTTNQPKQQSLGDRFERSMVQIMAIGLFGSA